MEYGAADLGFKMKNSGQTLCIISNLCFGRIIPAFKPVLWELGQALMLTDSRKRPPSLPSSSASVDDSSKCPCDYMEFIKNWRGNLALGLLEKHKQAVLTVERD